MIHEDQRLFLLDRDVFVALHDVRPLEQSLCRQERVVRRLDRDGCRLHHDVFQRSHAVGRHDHVVVLSTKALVPLEDVVVRMNDVVVGLNHDVSLANDVGCTMKQAVSLVKQSVCPRGRPAFRARGAAGSR